MLHLLKKLTYLINTFSNSVRVGITYASMEWTYKHTSMELTNPLCDDGQLEEMRGIGEMEW